MDQNLTLTHFSPEAIQEREDKAREESRIMNLLGRFSDGMLLKGLRENKDHPKPEWGDETTWRSHYIKECERRGYGLLEGLGWPSADHALYRNIHTGDGKVLKEILSTYMGWGGPRNSGKHLWTLVEHWQPVHLKTNEKIEVIENEREEKQKES